MSTTSTDTLKIARVEIDDPATRGLSNSIQPILYVQAEEFHKAYDVLNYVTPEDLYTDDDNYLWHFKQFMGLAEFTAFPIKELFTPHESFMGALGVAVHLSPGNRHIVALGNGWSSRCGVVNHVFGTDYMECTIKLFNQRPSDSTMSPMTYQVNVSAALVAEAIGRRTLRDFWSVQLMTSDNAGAKKYLVSEDEVKYRIVRVPGSY